MTIKSPTIVLNTRLTDYPFPYTLTRGWVATILLKRIDQEIIDCQGPGQIGLYEAGILLQVLAVSQNHLQ